MNKSVEHALEKAILGALPNQPGPPEKSRAALVQNAIAIFLREIAKEVAGTNKPTTREHQLIEVLEEAKDTLMFTAGRLHAYGKPANEIECVLGRIDEVLKESENG